jgi:hypothetical protein
MRNRSLLLLSKEPGVLLYQALALVSAAVVWLACQDAGEWSSYCGSFLFLALLSGLVLGVGWLPPLILFLFVCEEWVRPDHRVDWLASGQVLLEGRGWLLGCGLLGYVLSHYRLQGLQRALLPADLRLLGNSELAEPEAPQLDWPPRRAPVDVTAGELAWLVLTLPAWTAAGQLLLFALLLLPRFLDLSWEISRAVWFIWLAGLTVILFQLLLGGIRRWCLTAEQAQLALQDILWRETRGEQRRLQRWLAWDRLRRRPEEQP